MDQNPDIALKQRQFNAAMELYETRTRYRLTGKMVSLANVSLQAFLLFLAFRNTLGPLRQVASIIAAYLVADFINGLVHMYLDNNDNYTSPAGPFIAAFHLHHRTPVYKNNNLLLVYFNETGSKIWLVGYNLAAAAVITVLDPHPAVSSILAYTGVLSSIAEVSHYLCHVKGPYRSRYLAGLGLLLSRRHHGRHHIQDNVSYAFLNGLTDPLLDRIAARLYSGYKNTTDRHYALYTGRGTDNRN